MKKILMRLMLLIVSLLFIPYALASDISVEPLMNKVFDTTNNVINARANDAAFVPNKGIASEVRITGVGGDGKALLSFGTDTSANISIYNDDTGNEIWVDFFGGIATPTTTEAIGAWQIPSNYTLNVAIAATQLSFATTTGENATGFVYVTFER